MKSVVFTSYHWRIIISFSPAFKFATSKPSEFNAYATSVLLAPILIASTISVSFSGCASDSDSVSVWIAVVSSGFISLAVHAQSMDAATKEIMSILIFCIVFLFFPLLDFFFFSV